MKIVGINNGEKIRIILPQEVFTALLKMIHQQDEYLRDGIINFLCVNDFCPIPEESRDKLIFFEKNLTEKTKISDCIYGNIIQNFVEDIIRKDFKDLSWEDYEVTLPYSQTGNYVGSNFIYVNPFRIEKRKEFLQSIEESFSY